LAGWANVTKDQAIAQIANSNFLKTTASVSDTANAAVLIASDRARMLTETVVNATAGAAANYNKTPSLLKFSAACPSFAVTGTLRKGWPLLGSRAAHGGKTGRWRAGAFGQALAGSSWASRQCLQRVGSFVHPFIA